MVETKSGTQPVQLRNISARGAMIMGDIPSKVGEEILLRRENAVAPATIVWRRGSNLGIRFLVDIDEAAWLPHSRSTAVSSGSPEEFDEADAAASSPDPTSSAEVLQQRVAEELQLLSRTLESIAEDLSADAIVLRKFPKQVQDVVANADIARALGDLLSSQDPLEDMWKLRLEVLRRRLTRG
jgi:hypothetical protein